MNPKVAEIIEYMQNNEYFNSIKDIPKFAEILYKTYPTTDITRELKKMYLWIVSNPNRQKKNYKRFITNWMGRK